MPDARYTEIKIDGPCDILHQFRTSGQHLGERRAGVDADGDDVQLQQTDVCMTYASFVTTLMARKQRPNAIIVRLPCQYPTPNVSNGRGEGKR